MTKTSNEREKALREYEEEKEKLKEECVKVDELKKKILSDCGRLGRLRCKYPEDKQDFENLKTESAALEKQIKDQEKNRIV